jgi:hypothetical protein
MNGGDDDSARAQALVDEAADKALTVPIEIGRRLIEKPQ